MKFFRNAAIIGASEILVRAKGLFVLPLLAHRFGTVNYGAWAQVAALAAVVTPLITLGTENAVARFLPPEPPERQRQWFSAWVLALLVSAGATTAVLLIFRDTIARVAFGDRVAFAQLVPLSAASIFVGLLFAASRSWLRVRNNASAYSALTIVQALWNILATIVVVTHHGGPVMLIALLLAGDAVLSIVVLGAVLGPAPRPAPDLSILPRMVRFGLPLLPAGLAMWGLNLVDRLFLLHYHTLADVGVYSVAYSLGYLGIQVVVNPIWTMYANTAAELHDRGEPAAVQELFNRSLRLILTIMAPAIGGSAVVGALALSVLTPTAFRDGGPVIPIVMAGYLFTMISAYCEVSLGLVYRQHLSTVGILIALAVNLVFNFLLIPAYSYVGAAVATGAAFFTQLAFSGIMAIRAGLLKIDWRQIVRVIAASLVMTASVAATSRFVSGPRVLQLVVLAAVGIAVYSVTCIAFRVVRQAEIREALVMVRAWRAPPGPLPTLADGPP